MIFYNHVNQTWWIFRFLGKPPKMEKLFENYLRNQKVAFIFATKQFHYFNAMINLKISKITIVLFVLVLVTLHFLDSNVEPNWQPISYYAIGQMGYLMTMGFLAFGISFLFLGIYVFKNLPKIGSKIAGILLVLSAIGNFLAAFFNPDPIDTLPDNYSMSGQLHNMGAGMLGLFIIATIIITFQFYRQKPLKEFKKTMLLATLVLLLAELLLIGCLAIYLSTTNGMITADTPIGWPSRLVLLLCAVWVWVCATNLQKTVK